QPGSSRLRLKSAELMSNEPGHLAYYSEQEPFVHVRRLGHGSNAVVDEVKGMPSGEFAGKVFARKTLWVTFKGQVDEVLREVQMMKSLRHPHMISVVLAYEEIEERRKGRRPYKIIMEPVADTNLADYLEHIEDLLVTVSDSDKEHGQEARRVRDQLLGWFGCLAVGMAYIHEKRIRHGDIKPANILIRGSQVLYADFGLSQAFATSVTTKTYGKDGMQGTPRYVAPEIAGSKARGRSSDVFSLGCVFAEVLTVLSRMRLAAFASYLGPPGSRAYCAHPEKVLRWLFHTRALHVSNQSSSQSKDKGSYFDYDSMWSSSVLMQHPTPELRPMAYQVASAVHSSEWSRVTYQGCCSGFPFKQPPSRELGVVRPPMEICLNALSPKATISWDQIPQFRYHQ
ncbi:MAG: S-(hydroxymethyl)glutathione dehydrogenase, partial [Chaenotheca gracillima]